MSEGLFAASRSGRRDGGDRVAGRRRAGRGAGFAVLRRQTRSTVVVTFPAEVTNTIANSTTAKTRFVTGPAAIAVTRFHVGARQ